MKYNEGFTFVPAFKSCIQKSKALYSPAMAALVFPTDMLFNVVCSSKSSSLFLLLASWNTIASQVGASDNTFMSGYEFRAYQVLSTVSLVMYPLLQIIFSYDGILTTVLPQIVYECENFIIMNLIQITNYRFRRILKDLPPNSPARGRLQYYVFMNNILTLWIFLDFMGLMIINGDILRPATDRQINQVGGKMQLDFLTQTYSLGYVYCVLTIIVLLWPLNQKLAAGGRNSASATASQSVEMSASAKV